VKLSEMDELTLLDCSHAARELFNAAPRLSQDDQRTLYDYVTKRLETWRNRLRVQDTKQ
jgi:hypothetical protein